jgi:hypothetical protein
LFLQFLCKNSENYEDAMLLEFRLRNYRSFHQEAVLSLVASPDKHLANTNTAHIGLPALPRSVRSAVLYGANASGKSNLLRALGYMRAVILESHALLPGQTYAVQPFRLDAQSVNEPSLFEVSILLKGTRYQYGFEVTPQRIVAEWLLVYRKAKPQRWFSRRTDPHTGADIITTGDHLTGQKSVWREATRPNALFLSTAVQLNSEQLRPFHAWFAESLTILPEGGYLSPDYSTNLIQEPEGNRSIISLMAAADIAIASISAVRQKGVQHSITFDAATGKSDARAEERELLLPRFTHQAGPTKADFDFPDESLGTQKLFSLAGLLFDILEKGKLLVIDELDRSLHPLLVRQIIKTFHDSQLNKHGAQLIFSTHDTSLLDSSFMRRDQIWFVEKTENQSSQLTPLTEFSPRKGEALEKGYLGGRYGGVPILAEKLVDRVDNAQR